MVPVASFTGNIFLWGAAFGGEICPGAGLR